MLPALVAFQLNYAWQQPAVANYQIANCQFRIWRPQYLREIKIGIKKPVICTF